MIVITSKKEGFRRCGVAHAARPVEWPDERWTIDELDALLAEPMLTVELVEDPQPEVAAVNTAPEPDEMELDEPVAPLAGADAEADPAPADAEADPAGAGAMPAGKKAARKKATDK